MACKFKESCNYYSSCPTCTVMDGGPFKEAEDGSGRLIAYCGKYRKLEFNQLRNGKIIVEA